MLRNLAVLIRGSRAAGRLMAQFQPQVIFVTGGYSSIPVGVAAWLRRIPQLLYLPDIVPGLAVRFLGRLATRIAATTPDSARYLPRSKLVVSGYPVRSALWQADREQARSYFEFSMEEPVLLVYGGSSGARRINRAIEAALTDFLNQVSIIHVCGREGDEVWLRQRLEELPAGQQARYRLYPYLYQMPLAFAAADLVLCRSGASVLGELPAMGLPAILVPYPYVHQEENADYLVRHGAAIKVLDACLRTGDGRPAAEDLLRILQTLLEDRERLAGMAEAMRRLARPDAARVLVMQLRALAGEG